MQVSVVRTETKGAIGALFRSRIDTNSRSFYERSGDVVGNKD